MPQLTQKLWEPIPKEEIADLNRERIDHYRSFSAMVMGLGAFLAAFLWVWDFAIDPVGAPDALIYRILLIPVLGTFGVLHYFNIWPRYRTAQFVVTMIASQAFLYPIQEVLLNGHQIGFGAYLFWYIFVPLVGIGLPLRDTLLGMLALATAPLLWHALGLTPHMLVDVFLVYMWPSGSVVALILVVNDRIGLHMLRDRRLLVAAKEEAEHLARTDALTALNNRRAFFDLGTLTFRNARRYGHPVSVVLTDIDHFKAVNDTHGHAVGDRVIVRMARVIADHARDSDVVGRIGGEEFAIVMGETDAAAAQAFAERIRTQVEACRETDDQGGAVGFTASFGVAEGRAEDTSLDALLARADSALYAAKEAGRNTVRAAE